MAISGGIIGIAVTAIIVFSVAVPIVNDAIDSANLTTTQETIAKVGVTLLVVGIMVGIARATGVF